MSTRGFLALGVLTLSAAAAATAASSLGAPPVDDAPRLAHTEAKIRDLDIGFYQARARRDPHGARDRAQLGRLYLQRARETGNYDDLARAEASARTSLALRRSRNAAAYGVLTASLTAQHRFEEALDAARRLLALDSTELGPRAAVAEILLELGRYDEARHTFGMLATRRVDPVLAPRIARWEELRGRPEIARALLRAGRERLRAAHAAPTEQLAWYQLRLGDLALGQGRLSEAERELEAGLRMAPEDHRLLAANARLHLARGDARAALALGERALALTLDPATLGLMHDAALMLGDTAAADQYTGAMAVAVLGQPGALHRAWSRFLLDDDHDVPGILRRAREELSTRQDIYGWDLYAWALHRAGRHAEASEAMARALGLGTQDASLRFHGGMIARALGDTAGARVHLEAALDINPFWHPRHPGAARATLDSLRAGLAGP